MTIKFIAKPNLTKTQIKMCQEYLLSLQYGNIADNDSLGFINSVCNRYGATANELAWALEQIKAYDNQVRCQHCGVMWQIKQPIATIRHTIPYQRQWTCDSCQSFLQDSSFDEVSGCPIYPQRANQAYLVNF